MTQELMRLPFFTVPYPDECLYSIASRYHARSANPSPGVSFRELFPKSKGLSFSSTITTPFHLYTTDHWMDPALGYSKSRIIRYHTAFQLNAIRSYSGFPENEFILQKHSIQFSMIHPEMHLRFCPCCAEEQLKVYGEPYWQRLPQIRGAEYCPIHAVPFRNSPVSVSDARTNLTTAAQVLRDFSPDNVSHSNQRTKEAYIKESHNIQWLLNNGYRVSGVKENIHTAEKLFSLSENGLYGRKIEEIALDFFPRSFVYESFAPLKNPKFSYNSYTINDLKHWQVSILMTMAAGNAEKFARKREKMEQN